MEDDLTTKQKMEDDVKKNENGRQPHFFFEKLEWRPQQKMEDNLQKINGRRPHFFFEKLEWWPQKTQETTSKKWMEDDLKKFKKNWRRPQKNMEDEPINPNQPNWLWHHCKFT